MQIGTKPCQIKCSTSPLSGVALTSGVIKEKKTSNFALRDS